MLGHADQGFVDISTKALNVAIKGSILADPEACLVTKMAFPFGSTRARASERELIEAEYRSLIISVCSQFGALDRKRRR